MYKRHIFLILIVFVAVFGFSYCYKLEYEKIAESAINVVSIAMGIYIAAVSSILGSKYSKKLVNINDGEHKDKTLLGVLAEYLRWAGRASMFTIVISLINILGVFRGKGFFNGLIPAISFGSFSVNLIMFFLIFKFLINSLNKAVVSNNRI
jgi:hypothetical protein